MMDFNLGSQTYGAIRFKSVVPPSLAKWTMPGSQPLSAEGVFGTILLQQINAGTAQFVYTVCKIKEDLALDFTISDPAWFTYIALKNETRFDIAGINPVYLKQGQFNMIRSASMKGTFYMERGNEYHSIGIHYPGEQLQELLPFFPFLKSFIRESNSYKPLLLSRNHPWMDAQLMDSIGHLLHCTYRGNLRQLYFDYKIKELLLLLLNRGNTGTHATNELNDHTIELINEAKYIIEAGFGHSITLHSVARRLGISKVKLQDGFRQLFGAGMADNLLQTKMKKAKI